jgi:excisionase family DNA binding protein
MEAEMIVLDGEEYLTVEEAAGLLEIKPATLYAYVSRGVLKSYRQGIKRQRLYRRADVEALLRVAPSSAPAEAGAFAARRIPEIPLAESWIRE